MAGSSGTTLVTFLVRTPSNIRSVKLLGSWDNFSKEYVMEPDKRIGRGHWKGCHKFTNVICDGRVKTAPRRGRDGALKMGGTYWYHYLLDDDIDYYNEAEPFTTCCPFLPGQPVNVLNVPINLPSVETYHCRNGSVTPHQTMNPEDKYLNPRPPPRPTLPRLTTSPAMLAPGEALTSPLATSPMRPTHGRSMSHPREAPSRRNYRAAGGNISVDIKAAEGIPAKTNYNPIRNAFMAISSPRFAMKDLERDNGNNSSSQRSNASSEPGSRELRSDRANNQYLGVNYITPQYPGWCSNCSSPLRSPIDMTSREDLRSNTPGPVRHRRDLSVPRNRSSPAPQVDSFYTSDHRRARPASRTRAPTPFHDILRTASVSVPPTAAGKAYEHDERATSSTTVRKLDSSKPASAPTLDLNTKRLPTLPNSPSSVLDEEFASNPIYEPCLDQLNDQLKSHFSQSTTLSPDVPSLDSIALPGKSRFSEWTLDSEAMSPSSMPPMPAFNRNYPGIAAQGPSIKVFSPVGSTGTQTPICQHQRDENNTKPESSGLVTQPSIPDDHNLQVSGLYIIKQPSMDFHPSEPPHQDEKLYATSPSPPLHPSSNRTSEYQPEDSSSGIPTPLVGYHSDQLGVGWGNQCQSNKTDDVHTMMQELIAEMSYLANYIGESGATSGYSPPPTPF